eukprot:6184599-Pleurochrysis_carterae.AAC.3
MYKASSHRILKGRQRNARSCGSRACWSVIRRPPRRGAAAASTAAASASAAASAAAFASAAALLAARAHVGRVVLEYVTRHE